LDEVVYLEPYPKSKAEHFFKDHLRIEETMIDTAVREEATEELPYRPFRGISPGRQQQLVSWTERKTKEGEFIKFKDEDNSAMLRTSIETPRNEEERRLEKESLINREAERVAQLHDQIASALRLDGDPK